MYEGVYVAGGDTILAPISRYVREQRMEVCLPPPPPHYDTSLLATPLKANSGGVWLEHTARSCTAHMQKLSHSSKKMIQKTPRAHTETAEEARSRRRAHRVDQFWQLAEHEQRRPQARRPLEQQHTTVCRISTPHIATRQHYSAPCQHHSIGIVEHCYAACHTADSRP